jgi:transcriptional regulator with XRE-family HTH domain
MNNPSGIVLRYWNASGTLMAMMSVSDQLRERVKTSGMTLADIASEIGISTSMVSRFASSGRQLRSGSIDRLCAFFELTLKPIGKAKGGKGSKPASRKGRP